MEFCRSETESERTTAFSSMLKSGELTDVTLACEDGQIQAHKLILAEASPTLKSILNKYPHKHPLLYFHNFSKETMQFILEFVYSGQVQVPVQNLDKFCALAKTLKVKGLFDNQNVVVYSNFKAYPRSAYIEDKQANNDKSQRHNEGVTTLDNEVFLSDTVEESLVEDVNIESNEDVLAYEEEDKNYQNRDSTYHNEHNILLENENIISNSLEYEKQDHDETDSSETGARLSKYFSSYNLPGLSETLQMRTVNWVEKKSGYRMIYFGYI